jgi:hypothetical protein
VTGSKSEPALDSWAWIAKARAAARRAVAPEVPPAEAPAESSAGSPAEPPATTIDRPAGDTSD